MSCPVCKGKKGYGYYTANGQQAVEECGGCGGTGEGDRVRGTCSGCWRNRDKLISVGHVYGCKLAKADL